jgi:hypothetical protein
MGEKVVLAILENSDKLPFLDELVQNGAKRLESSVHQNRELKDGNEKLQHKIKQTKDLCQMCERELGRVSHLIKMKSAQL